MTKAMYIGIPNNPTVTLPSGYTQLEYIESTGTQYIDTGVSVSAQTYKRYRFVADVEYTVVDSSIWSVHGCSGGGVIYYFGLSTSKAIVYGNGTQDITTSVAVSEGRYLIDFSPYNNTYSFGDKQTLTGLTFNAPSGTQNFYLFAYNTSSGAGMHGERLYSFKIYDNGTLIRDFIPCKNSSGTLGLYDIVNSKFYTNGGSGTFKAGTVLDGKSFARKVNKMYVGVANKPTANLPSGYTEVEYIESSGTQYIDTGWNFGASNYTKAKIVFDAVVGTASNGWAVSGVGSNPIFYGGVGSNKNIYYGNGNKDIDTGVAYTENRVLFEVDLQNKTVKVTDKVTGSILVDLSSIEVGTPTATNTFFLFAYNGTGTAHCHNEKLYSYKIYENGIMVRNFIPAKNSSGSVGLYDVVNSKFYTNNGTGTFTTGATLDGKSIARKVKKAYIGVNGIARLFFGGKELRYKGTATSLSVSAGMVTGASNVNYALFAGGYTGGNSSAVDAYDSSLTKRTPTGLNSGKYSMAGATVGEYALFAGGQSGSSSYINVVEAYNSKLTRSNPNNIAAARANLAGATVGNYALFAGGDASGSTRSSKVDTYNSSLTRSSATALSEMSSNLAGASIGNYALFAGGSNGSTYRSSVHAYDSSLTRSTPTALSVARYALAGTNVGDYAIFAGGYAGSDYCGDVDVYDKSLTKVSAPALSVRRRHLTATTLGDYAIFAGGLGWGNMDTVDVFDTSLTMTTITGLSKARYYLASATIGNYALIAGGQGSDGYYNTVDVYELA